MDRIYSLFSGRRPFLNQSLNMMLLIDNNLISIAVAEQYLSFRVDIIIETDGVSSKGCLFNVSIGSAC